MARNMYAKPTTTNASFLKVPVNMSSDTNANLTWGQLAAKLPVLLGDGSTPIKAIKLGAITVGGSPDAPAHLEFKGGQTFDLPALANKPMRVKASEKNLYVSGWRRIAVVNDTVKVSSNTDDDDLTESVVFSYRGQVAFIEVALRFYDDEGYRPWYSGGDLPSGPYEVFYWVPRALTRIIKDNRYSNTVKGGREYYITSYRTLLHYTESNLWVVGEDLTFQSEAEATNFMSLHAGALLNTYDGELKFACLSVSIQTDDHEASPYMKDLSQASWEVGTDSGTIYVKVSTIS